MIPCMTSCMTTDVQDEGHIGAPNLRTPKILRKGHKIRRELHVLWVYIYIRK